MASSYLAQLGPQAAPLGSTSAFLSRALFRAFVRLARRVPAETPLAIRELVDPSRWGHPGAWSRWEGESERTLRMLLPHLPVGQPSSAVFTRDSLIVVAKENFAHPLDRGQRARERSAARHGASFLSQQAMHARKPTDDDDDQRQRLDYALTALRVLSSQLSLAERTCRSGGTETNGIVVETAVAPHHDHGGRGEELFSKSSPSSSGDQSGDPGVFRYCYRVRVENHGSSSVRLVGRSWIFKGADGSVASCVPRWGKGVVGMEPVLEPGDVYEYYSGSTIPTREGVMEGALLFLGPSDVPERLAKLRLPTQDEMSTGNVNIPGTGTFEVQVDSLILKP